MAEAILFSIAEEIIGKLGSAVVEDIGSIWGVKDELQQLENTISTIKDVLLDAEEKQWHNRQVRNWLKRLEGVVYDADDLMDDFSTEALRCSLMAGNNLAKKVTIFFSTSNQIVFRCKMASKIKYIKKKIDAIGVDRKLFNLVEGREEAVVVSRMREHTHSFVPHHEVIGREKDKMAIIQLLLESNIKGNVSVVPIVGIGGLGKTTLAQLVFNDERVQQHFELKMWVCVSHVFDVKLLVKKIVESALNRSLANIEMETLQKNLREQINGKRFLLVLDDVWNDNHQKWFSLKNLLTHGAEESRIIVTTRSKKVAKITADTIQVYELGVLDEDQSWSLFKKMAFEQGKDPKKDSVFKIGKKIVQKCGGIPLAIKTIGGMLSFKNPDTEWQLFDEIELSRISQEEEDIIPTLKLSYDCLPSHLKHCFAYCSLFPKNYKIDVQNLIKLWTAQGFVKSSNSNRCLEDVAVEYFMDLLWRSFFQDAEIDEVGNITKCKMHDLMHDLATLVAGTTCTMLGLDKEDFNKETHHVSFDIHELDSSKVIPTSLFQRNKIRTIIFLRSYFHSDRFLFSPMNMLIGDTFISNFKFLRSLDLHDLGIRKLPNSIGKLKHLRYLDLSKNSYLKTLPDSITNLHNLQTLKVSLCIGLQGLPNDLRKLVNLRHLETDGCEVLDHLPPGLNQLTSLQTLSYFPLTKGKGSEPNELAGLNNLRGRLFIDHLRYGKEFSVEYNAANLKEKQYLQALSLRWCSDEEAEKTKPVGFEETLEDLQPHPNLKELSLYYYRGIKFGSWFPSLTNLISFRLWSCKECHHLPPLNQFPSLKVLSLDDIPNLEYIWNDGDGDFDCSSSPKEILQFLQKLRLVKLPNLKGWWRNVVNGEQNNMLPSFPCLSSLIIRDCPKLTCMPLYPCLEEQLVLENTSWKPFQQTMINIAEPCMLTILATEEASSSSTYCSYPLTKLKALHIVGIVDLECLSDLNRFISLKSLKVDNCPNLKQLSPGIQHLSSLQELLISRCPKLEFLSSEDPTMQQDAQHITTLQTCFSNSISSSSSSNLFLQSVQKLHLIKLPNLKGWWRDVVNIEQNNMLTSFPCLSTLIIEDCPNLTCMPLYPYVEEQLVLKNTRWKPFQQTMRFVARQCVLTTSATEGASSSSASISSSSSPLAKLKAFHIAWIGELESLSNLNSFISLKYLKVENCPNLKQLSPGIQHLGSLQELLISSCPKVEYLSNEDEAVCITLQKLQILRCDSLIAIPEWICNLKFLKELEIWGCPNLKSVPEAIRSRRITSVQKLKIDF